MAASASAVWALEESPDPNVPICRGRSPQDIAFCKQGAKAFVPGLRKTADKRSGAGARLLLNLREAAAKAFIVVDACDFEHDDQDLAENCQACAAVTPTGQNDAKWGAGWRKLLWQLSVAFPR